MANPPKPYNPAIDNPPLTPQPLPGTPDEPSDPDDPPLDPSDRGENKLSVSTGTWTDEAGGSSSGLRYAICFAIEYVQAPHTARPITGMSLPEVHK
jgi:hypothetical protein